MTSIAEVIGWKFNHQDGMKTVDGVITEFPGGIPTQAEQDAWTAEYLARDTAEERIDESFPQTDVARVIFEAFFEMANMIRELQDTVNGTTQGPITRAQLKTWLKNKLP